MWRALAHLPPVGAWITPSLLRTLCNLVSPGSKNIKRLTYEATPDSATVEKLCFQPAQTHPRSGATASTSCRAAGAVARASRRKKN